MALSLDVKHITAAEGIRYGLRQEWLSGERSNPSESPVKFDLASGSGIGTPWLILTVTVDGENYYSVADIRDIVEPWIVEVLSHRSSE